MDDAVTTLVEMERAAIIAALRHTRGNMDGAAWLLGIGRSTLYRKVRSYEIVPSEYMVLAAKAGQGTN